MKITKSKSNRFWLRLRDQILSDFNNDNLWKEAYDLFIERINSRYLDYVNLIEQNGNNSGEGFAIMTIYCALIEFLETTYQGKNFNDCKKKELKEYEYGFGESRNFYTSFLTKRNPFKLSKDLAKEFYRKVRCGLLHEAQTRGGWKIRVDNAELITQKNEEFVVNRVIFKKKIEQYLILYKKHLFLEDDLKHAFIRKFNGICEN